MKLAAEQCVKRAKVLRKFPAATGETVQSQSYRMLEATALLGIWMLVGFWLKLDANSYLLLGLPITVVFQLLIRKAPLRDLWVRNGPPLHISQLKPIAKLVALIFAAANVLLTYEYYVATHNWIFVLYELVAILGTIPMAYSLHNFTRQMIRPLVMCLATAGILVVAIDIVTYWASVFELHTIAPVTAERFLYNWLVSMVQYLPVVFLLEEVWFRGAFDSHIYHIGEKHWKLTALYVSVLWGAWHFPIAYTPRLGLEGSVVVLGELVLFQGAVGYFLSIYWRKSGNLLVPGSVHAFVDSVRNGFGLV